MLTRHCRLCGFEKEDLQATICQGCQEDEAKIQKNAEDNKLTYWQAQELIQAGRNQRRKTSGMSGRMDPRQHVPRIDTTQLAERGLI